MDNDHNIAQGFRMEDLRLPPGTIVFQVPPYNSAQANSHPQGIPQDTKQLHLPQYPMDPRYPVTPQYPMTQQNPGNPVNPQNPVNPRVALNSQNVVVQENQVPQPQDAQQLGQNLELPTDSPGMMMCPQCQRVVYTRIKHRAGCLVWLIFVLLFIVFICLFPISLVPFFVRTCKDVDHSCPYCYRVLHTHKRAC